jgi:molybdate transport system substrate-binding protein
MLASLAVACGGDDRPASPSTGSPHPGSAHVTGEVTVFAAASLTGAFTEIAAAFEAAHPGVNVVFNFGGTPTLRTQLEQGARADVFASANLEQMDLATAGGVIEASASTFARNSLVIITPKDNPANVEAPADLANEGLKLVVANEDVPVGNYTRQLLMAMGKSGDFEAGFMQKVLDNVVSLESNVKQIVAKVELGEADAGVVYGTDVTPDVAANLNEIEVPDEYNVIASYPIALVKERSNEGAAQAFIDFVLSEAGQGILQKYGFLSAG